MQKLMKRLHKNEKGFTLVELMVVVIIIGILVAIAIPLFGAVRTNAETRACQANIRTVNGAVNMYFAEESVYPGALADLVDYVENADVLGCPGTGTNAGVYSTTGGGDTPLRVECSQPTHNPGPAGGGGGS